MPADLAVGAIVMQNLPLVAIRPTVLRTRSLHLWVMHHEWPGWFGMGSW